MSQFCPRGLAGQCRETHFDEKPDAEEVSCVRPGTNLESKAAGGSGNGGPTQNEGVVAPAGQKDGCADGRKLQKWHLHSEVVTPAECAICTYLWMNIALSGNRVRMIQDSREKDEIKQATARVCL